MIEFVLIVLEKLLKNFFKKIIQRIEKGHYPVLVMVGFGGVSFEGVIQLYFCEQEAKTRAIDYQSDISEKLVKLLSDYLFAG